MLLLLPLSSKANDSGERRTIFDQEVINAIIEVESSYSPNALGDNGLAVGILQIHPIMVREANRIIKKQKYKYSDRKDRQKSIEVFLIYQRHWNPTGDVRLGCKLWNSGCDANGGDEYYEKVAKILAQ